MNIAVPLRWLYLARSPILALAACLSQFQSSQFQSSQLTVLPAAQDSSGAAESQVTIVTVSGERLTGSLLGIDEAGNVRLQGNEQPVRLNDIAVIETNRPVDESAGTFQLQLVGGSQFQADAVTMRDDQYSIRTTALELYLGPEAIRLIGMPGSQNSQLLTALLQEPSATEDRIIARSSRGEQAVPGLVKQLDAERVHLEYRGQIRRISLEKVVAIVLADLKQELPAGTRGSVQLIDGTTLYGTLVFLDNNQLQLGLVGSRALVDWQHVAKISIRSDRVRFLSDLEPVEVDQQAIGSARFNWQADRNVYGQPLSLWDPETEQYRQAARGLGTHSYCRLEFDISGADYQSFSATVGLDRESRQRGDCLVAVEGDGQELWSAHISGDQAPQPIDLDVRGVRRLALVVKPGNHLDLGDHVNWVNARLIKSAE